ncbi:hypothetical protein COCC4DRAFT_37747 [Bipolaris maydis ATCC 48331]|uniref:Rhodopsin domain-containing protein n=2 Tax=Cochliobolus heterostrophus TaxID=5016 RepID=M2UF16_COCH5|nr:uncharacterized protein COCC4DRAFT_37747 [Bipolaris maydis ATCC 48331]EMD92281.1 hypothetical protein COCHEDRAFT_1099368 [Bipolaris maydis C5]KAJ5022127.1 hypothetical protein J3E73DRAFT_374392 [Bipolaris maydis]ENI07973.1 hypothetical protein COCC4DRAFT_37747 [Bipolaris maydis ATCC 48331]KAJ6197951.1 hypothetical protein J3E72DRAFT_189205 [Bipolaris maydis]KAJ6210080.1 hypothetical protein PSV09DRAFT_1099368 [Bipolaris maydis]
MIAPRKNPITKDELMRTNVAMLILASLFILSRVILQITKRRAFGLPDFFIYLAFVLFVSMWTCYIVITPTMFRIFDALEGLTQPYATILDDAGMLLRYITAAQMLFYTLLFTVKMSLLTFYRKILTGLPAIYDRIWWGTLAFCIVSWIGSIFTSIFRSDDLNEDLSKGRFAGTPNEQQKIIFSLYFAYSVDVATDLAIMFLPLFLTWNLQMSMKRKIGISILFGSGFVCIAFATLRVIQLGIDRRGKTRIPELDWSFLWNVVECAISVIIGCSPAFTGMIRKRIVTIPGPAYDKQGYIKQVSNEVEMGIMTGSASQQRQMARDPYMEFFQNSQEELTITNNNSQEELTQTTEHSVAVRAVS